MPLNLSNEFTPHVRWMAQTSTWRKSTDDGPEIVEWDHALFDLENIQTGWGLFAEGEAPEWVLDPSLDVKAPKPADGKDWRRGFKVSVFSDSIFDGVREFATTATGAGMGIKLLYEEFEQNRKHHASKVPVVKFTGSTPRRIGKGNTNVPNFAIVDWVDRPVALVSEQPVAAPVPPRSERASFHTSSTTGKMPANTEFPDDPLPYQL